MRPLNIPIVFACALLAAWSSRGADARDDLNEPVLPAPYGKVVRCQATIAPGPAGIKAPPPYGILTLLSVNGKDLASPVSIKGGAFAVHAGDQLRGWLKARPGDARTVYGYEVVNMTGIPNGIADHPALRDLPQPAMTGFAIYRTFVVLHVE